MALVGVELETLGFRARRADMFLPVASCDNQITAPLCIIFARANQR